MKRLAVCALGLLASLQLLSYSALARDYTYRRVINHLALASLPTNFPAFIHTPAAEQRIAFVSGEPDRSRNVQDLSFSHCTAPD